MKIVSLSDSDLAGGAAIANYRLFKALQKNDPQINLLVRNKLSNDPAVICPSDIITKIKSKIYPYSEYFFRKIHHTSLPFMHSYAYFSSLNNQVIQSLNPDIVHLGWICNGYLRPEDLLSIKKPIVWTIHDMWPFCGSEHYTYNENRYEKGYSILNRKPLKSLIDLDRYVWERKYKAWKNINLTIVSPSKWLAECAKKSYLFKNYQVEVIPNCIDTRIFKPINKNLARKILNLPLNRTYLLFGANGALTDYRKGYRYFVDAVNSLPNNSKYEVLIFGNDLSTKKSDVQFKTTELGKITTDKDLAIVYSAADVFIAPSVIDNLPNTIMESMSCGTPCIAFMTGGIPDLIDHKVNGFLAKQLDSADLASGILWVLGNKNRLLHLADFARKKVQKNYCYKIVSEKYLNLFINAQK